MAVIENYHRITRENLVDLLSKDNPNMKHIMVNDLFIGLGFNGWLKLAKRWCIINNYYLGSYLGDFSWDSTCGMPKYLLGDRCYI